MELNLIIIRDCWIILIFNQNLSNLVWFYIFLTVTKHMSLARKEKKKDTSVLIMAILA